MRAAGHKVRKRLIRFKLLSSIRDNSKVFAKIVEDTFALTWTLRDLTHVRACPDERSAHAQIKARTYSNNSKSCKSSSMLIFIAIINQLARTS